MAASLQVQLSHANDVIYRQLFTRTSIQRRTCSSVLATSVKLYNDNDVLQFELLGSHTVVVSVVCRLSVVCLSVPRQMSKTKRDRREILSPL